MTPLRNFSDIWQSRRGGRKNATRFSTELPYEDPVMNGWDPESLVSFCDVVENVN